MNREVKVGDVVMVSRYNEDEVNKEAEVVAVLTETMEVEFLDGRSRAVLLREDGTTDSWKLSYEAPKEEGRKDVKIGDKIMVTKIDGEVLDVPHLAIVADYDNYFSRWIDMEHKINGEDTLHMDRREIDVWYPLGEYVSKKLGSGLLGALPSPILYDDEALSPSYSEAIKAGMTFAEYTGENITVESLDFVSDVDESISTITPETLAFEEDEEDSVNHPNHYNSGRFETIEMIEEITKGYDDGFVSYCVGNAVKYLSRAPFKHETPEEDIEKAAKYLEFALNRLNK